MVTETQGSYGWIYATEISYALHYVIEDLSQTDAGAKLAMLHIHLFEGSGAGGDSDAYAIQIGRHIAL